MPLFRRKGSNQAKPSSAPSAAPSAAPYPSPPAATPPGRQPHLLVCDDNESVTQLVGMMFSHESWTVEVARSGQECLAALDRRVPDVVLLDQQLGEGLTGLQTAARARKAGFDRPILLFSAHLDDKARKRSAQLDVLAVSKLDFPAVVRHVTAAHRAYTRRRTAPEARAAARAT